MKHYFLSPLAEQDIEEIVSYLAAENPSAALTLLNEVYEAMDMLASNPGIGYKKAFLKDKNIRFWPFKWHYLIIYREKTPLEIARVLSGYRDLPQLFS